MLRREAGGATVAELEGVSLAVAVSGPEEVTHLIRDTVRATS
ncbi:hypothetical protein ACFYZJ_07385 [Streptomyces sp. NPDC001848]